jgi:methionyl-tRNA formyltransferase
MERYIKTQGIDIQSLSSPVANPADHVAVQLQFISGITRIPLRILTGSERGELASVQDEYKATYFNKRTPEDAAINWDWQKERIRNWVRAQAYPYPGAFTIINNQRVIIDEIIYSDIGFKQDLPNGLVLGISPVLVKTQNGVVELKTIRAGKELIEKGMTL